mgnify:CR=1 FL=1
MKTIKIIVAATALLIMLSAGNTLNAQDMKKNEVPKLSAFTVGDRNPEVNARFFSGKFYFAPLTLDAQTSSRVYNETFEPACRNNWHSHSKGQILLAIGGKGYYQEEGKDAILMMPGDVVEIGPNVVHWHGATPDSWFSHIGVTPEDANNKTTWLNPVNEKEYAEATAKKTTETLPGYFATLATTDPELSEIMIHFACVETSQHIDLDLKTRILVTMASAIGLNAREEYRQTVYTALANDISPIEIKEVLYHSVPYAGMGKIADLIGIANEVLAENGVSLPLPNQATVTEETRFEKGLELQRYIFGSRIDASNSSAPKNQQHFRRFLSDNCFGDYQTRPAFDAKMRELLTYAILISQGGCEPQVKSHIQGNVNLGNDKTVLLAVTTQLLPNIGYPRALNAVACLNEVIPEKK